MNNHVIQAGKAASRPLVSNKKHFNSVSHLKCLLLLNCQVWSARYNYRNTKFKTVTA